MKLFALALLMLAATLPGVTALAQTTSAPTPAVAAPPGDAVKGKADFLSYGCYECHGTVAQGNRSGAGPALAPNTPPWSVVSTYPRRPTGEMPAFAPSILPDKDLADIYAYLKSIPPAKPPSQIPDLSGIGTNSK